MKEIPVLHARGKSLAEAYENALVELYANGGRMSTQYDKPGDPQSIDATMNITIEEPLSDPMIHKAFPGGIQDLREYVYELEGLKDSWTKNINDPKDTRWEYTYHQRLGSYGQYKGEFLHAFIDTEIVKSHLPVEIERGNDRFSGNTMDFDNIAQTLKLEGRVRGTIVPKKSKAP